MGTYRGLTRLQGGQWNPPGIKKYLPGTQISAIYEDEEGVLWIGAYSTGITRLKGEQISSYTQAVGLGSEYIFQILEMRYVDKK